MVGVARPGRPRRRRVQLVPLTPLDRTQGEGKMKRRGRAAALKKRCTGGVRVPWIAYERLEILRARVKTWATACTRQGRKDLAKSRKAKKRAKQGTWDAACWVVGGGLWQGPFLESDTALKVHQGWHGDVERPIHWAGDLLVETWGTGKGPETGQARRAVACGVGHGRWPGEGGQAKESWTVIWQGWRVSYEEVLGGGGGRP